MGAEYEGWLSRQPLSANTKRAYRTRVSQYLGYLAATPAEYGDPLEDLRARDYAVRDYKGHLKAVRKAKPSSVNLSLAAIDNFCLFLGIGRPEVSALVSPKPRLRGRGTMPHCYFEAMQPGGWEPFAGVPLG